MCISRRVMLWTLHSLLFVIKSSYFGAGQTQIQLSALTWTLSKLLCSLNLFPQLEDERNNGTHHQGLPWGFK